MGYRFYLWLAAIAFAVAAGFRLVLLPSRARSMRGASSARSWLSPPCVLVAWTYDRREARIRDSYLSPG